MKSILCLLYFSTACLEPLSYIRLCGFLQVNSMPYFFVHCGSHLCGLGLLHNDGLLKSRRQSNNLEPCYTFQNTLPLGGNSFFIGWVWDMGWWARCRTMFPYVLSSFQMLRQLFAMLGSTSWIFSLFVVTVVHVANAELPTSNRKSC